MGQNTKKHFETT